MYNSLLQVNKFFSNIMFRNIIFLSDPIEIKYLIILVVQILIKNVKEKIHKKNTV